MSTCYMCPAPSVSDEHVPPLCIFPEKKDLPDGIDFRRNLITVPSCAEHNLTKSGDDEYLLYVITSNISTNDYARRQWITKIRRSYRRRPSKLRMFGPISSVRVGQVKTGLFFLDKGRIDTELERITRGLCFHASGSPWDAPIDILSPSFIATSSTDGDAANTRSARLIAITSRFLSSEPWRGDNPGIFRFQFRREESPPGIAARMLFYEKFEVVALSIIAGTPGDA